MKSKIPNRVWFRFCKFRTKPYLLEYGGAEHGVKFEWLGISISLGTV